MQNKFCHRIVSNPILSIVITLCITIIFALNIFKIKSSYSPRIWFDSKHPTIVELDTYERRYGNDESITIAVELSSPLNKATDLKVIEELTAQMWRIPDVIRVESLTNYNIITSEEKEINIRPLSTFTNDKEFLKAIDDNKSDLTNYMIDSGRKFIVTYGILKPEFGEEQKGTLIKKRALELANDIAKKYQVKTILLGTVTLTEYFREISSHDSKTIIPFMALLIFLGLYLLFRSITQTLLALCICLTTVATTFGLQGILGLTYNNLISSVPGVLLAICIADSIHIFSFYNNNFHEDRVQRLLNALKSNFISTILTSITTSIGFLTLTQTELVPIKTMAILCSFGTVIAWLYTYLLSSALIFFKPPKFRDSKMKAKFNKLLDVINNHQRKIVLAFIVMFIAGVSIGMRNNVNANVMEYFSPRTQAKKDYVYSKNKMEAVRGISFEIDSGKDSGINNPDFLHKVERFSEETLRFPYVTKVSSPLHIIKKMNQNFALDGLYALPDNEAKVSNLLFLYDISSSPERNLSNLITVDHRYMKLQVQWKLENSTEMQQKSDDILKLAEKFNLKLKKIGQQSIFMTMNDQVVSTFAKSIAMAILLVSIVLFFVFRDFKSSIIALAPNIIPLSIGTAVMTLTSKPLDIGTAIVCSVCLGIAVDDTIHFMVNYLQYVKDGYSTRESIIKTLNKCGLALVSTTLILLSGFACFIFGDFVPNINFGILLIIILSFALITDLVFLPACLLLTSKK